MSVYTEIAHDHPEDEAVRSNSAKERARNVRAECAEVPTLDGRSGPGPSHARSDELIFFSHSPSRIPLPRSAGASPKLNSVAIRLARVSCSTSRTFDGPNSLAKGASAWPK